MSTLTDELKNDPLKRGYAQMDDVAVENDMNNPIHPVVGLISIGTFVSTLYESGTFDALYMAKIQGDPVATAAMEKLVLMKTLGIENIDMGSEKATSDLEMSGVPPTDIETLKARATTIKSRAQMLGVQVNATLVAEARK